eukprot:TRINITY_DN4345_c0_g1_i29.p1 TRINITY_DN4345_c0_g1~~TRINITY_DN4345_c0_g1_i29.p1  ORF type:complete len:341 (-),score=34.40 TRINITY_DN4345_c0_g1_i29:108-1130(-)
MPKCRDSIHVMDLPNGKEIYNYLVGKLAVINVSYQDIHSIGLTEVSRIRSLMEQIANRSGHDFAGYVSQISHDPNYFFKTPEELLTYIRSTCKRIDSKLPQFFRKLPICPYGVEAIPDYEAPSTAGAYYMSPPLDCSRAGFYYVNTYDLSSRPSYLYLSTSLHESVPGHHLQIALSNEINIPKFRQLDDQNAYVEGWALYAETLGWAMGFYDTDTLAFGAHSDQIFRACRLVIDTGIHALGWTRDRAINYLKDNTAMGMQDIEAEIDRYIAMPGQALGYKMGELQIRELRDRFSSSLGTKFDIREFHDFILETGPVPLDILQKFVCSKYSQRHGSSVLCE